LSNAVVTVLSIREKAKIEDLLNKEPSINGFVLSDVEYEHYASDFVRLYGQFDGDDLKSVLMIFKDKIVYYAADDNLPVDCYVQYVKESKVSKLVGKKSLIEKFMPYLEIKGHNDCYVLVMSTLAPPIPDDDLTIKRMTSREEAAKLHDLYMQIEEYSFTGLDKEQFIDEQVNLLQNDSIRTFFAEVDGEIVSTATYLNDRPRTAIVIGLATLPKYRNQGYATKVLYKLCSDAINAGKVLYLFYSNPAAGSVYRKIEFREGGAWKILQLS
jgi:predicted GNAT family acetyltransferase